MKFVRKVDDSFALGSLFGDHLAKFSMKHEHELAFMDDVKNFVEKKCQLELQYSQSLSKLCGQFTSKAGYQINSDAATDIYVPEKWRLMLEQYEYIAEKKQVSCRSLLMHCEYFREMREQKQAAHQLALSYLKRLHTILSETNKTSQLAFKSYCLEQFLSDQVNNRKRTTNTTLEKRLKKRGINLVKFKKAYEEMIRSDENVRERRKKLDLAKLNYATANYCQNQQLQYYFSMELPELFHMQNAQLDVFVDQCIDSLAFKELDQCKFFIRQFEESVFGIGDVTTNSTKEQKHQQQQQQTPRDRAGTYNTSENYFIETHSSLNNLIQFELEPHDKEETFEFSFQKDNVKLLCSDYAKWSSKLNELEQLMCTMLAQLNAKRSAAPATSTSVGVKTASASHASADPYASNTDSTTALAIDKPLAEMRFLIAEKKMQMIQLQAKTDALGAFNINLKELDDYNSAAKFAENRTEFDADLHQNLELWDSLMKSIDEMHFSDDSYDLDVQRKGSADFLHSDSTSGASSCGDGSCSDLLFQHTGELTATTLASAGHRRTRSPPGRQIAVDPSEKARYARTLCNFQAKNEKDYLSFNYNQSLIVYNKVSHDAYKAKDCFGHVGFVNECNLEFYTESAIQLARSVYIYEGLDERELSFPAEAVVRLLRKNPSAKKIDGEEWWEGVYNERIGFFPAVFVQVEENGVSQNDDHHWTTTRKSESSSSSSSSTVSFPSAGSCSFSDELAAQFATPLAVAAKGTKFAMINSPDNQTVPQ